MQTSCPTLNQLFHLTSVNAKPLLDTITVDSRRAVDEQQNIHLIVIVGDRLVAADRDVRWHDRIIYQLRNFHRRVNILHELFSTSSQPATPASARLEAPHRKWAWRHEAGVQAARCGLQSAIDTEIKNTRYSSVCVNRSAILQMAKRFSAEQKTEHMDYGATAFWEHRAAPVEHYGE